jgi:hypothetical protein
MVAPRLRVIMGAVYRHFRTIGSAQPETPAWKASRRFGDEFALVGVAAHFSVLRNRSRQRFPGADGS